MSVAGLVTKRVVARSVTATTSVMRSVAEGAESARGVQITKMRSGPGVEPRMMTRIGSVSGASEGKEIPKRRIATGAAGTVVGTTGIAMIHITRLAIVMIPTMTHTPGAEGGTIRTMTTAGPVASAI